MGVLFRSFVEGFLFVPLFFFILGTHLETAAASLWVAIGIGSTGLSEEKPLPLTYGAVFVWNGLDVQDVAGLNVGYVGPTDTMVTVVSRLGRL